MSSLAVVARTTDHGLAFLAHSTGRTDWTAAGANAAIFASIREATRAALRLPGRYRAFALPGDTSTWSAQSRPD
jgi:hypothetical protein